MQVRPRSLKEPPGDRPYFQGTADQLLADIRSYAQLGVTHFVFDFTQPDLRAALETLERFAHEVRPRAAGAAGAGRRRAAAASGRAAGVKASNGAGRARAAGRRRKGRR
jgi:hypothetical protein